MAQIQDVPQASGFLDGFAHGFANTFLGAEERSRINVALQRDAGSKHSPRFAQVGTPIHAQDIRAGTREAAEKMPGSLRI